MIRCVEPDVASGINNGHTRVGPSRIHHATLLSRRSRCKVQKIPTPRRVGKAKLGSVARPMVAASSLQQSTANITFKTPLYGRRIVQAMFNRPLVVLLTRYHFPDFRSPPI